MQKLKTVPAQAGGASGGPGNRTPAKVEEWYTIVVYEKRRVKKVVLYVGRKTFTFNIPADVNVGNIAVIMRRWLAGGKTHAYSARIHVENLVELIRTYVRGAEKEELLNAIGAAQTEESRAADAPQAESHVADAPDAAARVAAPSHVHVAVNSRPHAELRGQYISSEEAVEYAKRRLKQRGSVKMSKNGGGAHLHAGGEAVLDRGEYGAV